jgi:hypothetical protein
MIERYEMPISIKQTKRDPPAGGRAFHMFPLKIKTQINI